MDADPGHEEASPQGVVREFCLALGRPGQARDSHQPLEKGPGHRPAGGSGATGGACLRAVMKRWHPSLLTTGVAVATTSITSTMRRPASPRPSSHLAVALCGGGNSNVDHRNVSSPAAENSCRVSPWM